MDTPSGIRGLSRRGWRYGPQKLGILTLALILLLAGVAAIWNLRAAHKPRNPLRILVVRAAADPGCGLDDSEAQVLSGLMEDVLEGYGNCSVAKAEMMPDVTTWAPPAPQGLVIRLHPRRVHEHLALDFELASPDRILRSQPFIWRSLAPAPPLEAFGNLLNSLPLERPEPGLESLLPGTPDAFWKLHSALDVARRSIPTPQAFNAVQSSLQMAPNCALPEYVMARLHYLCAQHAEGNPDDLRKAEQHYEAALRITPNYPSGLYDLTRLKSDTGSAEKALGMLLKFKASRPHSRAILGGLAYCARFVGLLDLAIHANARASELDLNPKAPPRLQLAYFYQGNLLPFERSLYLRPGSYSNNVVQFYMGRLALHRGLESQAIAHFEEGEGSLGGNPSVALLCRCFRLVLQNQLPQARKDLERVRGQMNSALIPDGEMTLNLAEAYLLLGDQDMAMDLMAQSIHQGFRCTPWFELNPILAPLRKTPRWQELHRQLRDQQKRLRSEFPETDWGL